MCSHSSLAFTKASAWAWVGYCWPIPLAGGLVFLSLTGLLLWTKLHGSRLTMAGLGLTSLGLAAFFMLNAL